MSRADACSICGTGVYILTTPSSVNAKKGNILVHETAETIEEVGPDVKRYKPNDWVVKNVKMVIIL